jgi:hypothetical protein
MIFIMFYINVLNCKPEEKTKQKVKKKINAIICSEIQFIIEVFKTICSQ